MPKFNANLSMLFNEVDFLDRFSRAKQCGFEGVEFLFPYAFEANEILDKLEENQLEMVLFNLPPGNFQNGDRGLAVDPKRKGEFQDSVGRAIEYAKVLNCSKLHCMAGLTPDEFEANTLTENYISNIQFAADACKPHNIDILIEAINTRDIPGYFLNYSSQALDVLSKVNRPNTYFQYDIYHMQVMEGDLIPTIQRILPMIKHMQLADTPGRHEPGTGEINYGNLFNAIDEMGYDGWIGCEYRPKENTEDGLSWIKPYL